MTIMVCLSVWRFLRGDPDAAAAVIAGPAAMPGSTEPASPLGSAS